MFGINGVGGFIVLVGTLVAILVGLGALAIKTQKENASNSYSIENKQPVIKKIVQNPPKKEEVSSDQVEVLTAPLVEKVSEKEKDPVASVVVETMGAGNVEAGKATYGVCVACHGVDGAGNKLLNAPRIAGQQTWYLIRQLKNFKAGIRGSNEQDLYGSQMRSMTLALSDDDMKNLAAYLVNLK